MANGIIIASGLSKTVELAEQSLDIISNLTLEIQAGEQVAIIGESGAGKSTLLALLAGLDTPTEGEVSLDGQKLSTLSEDEKAALREQKLAFVFQSFLLLPHLSALENVALPLLLQGRRDADERAKALLAEVGLSSRLHHTPGRLSGGEQQRVALARAFVVQPKVLFADEPTGNLDLNTGKQIVDLLFSLNEKHGTTLVLVTHDQQLADRCQRILKLERGDKLIELDTSSGDKL